MGLKSGKSDVLLHGPLPRCAFELNILAHASLSLFVFSQAITFHSSTASPEIEGHTHPSHEPGVCMCAPRISIFPSPTKRGTGRKRKEKDSLCLPVVKMFFLIKKCRLGILEAPGCSGERHLGPLGVSVLSPLLSYICKDIYTQWRAWHLPRSLTVS